MADIKDNLQVIRELKEELWKLVIATPNLQDPEILRLSKKIDELLNENDKITFPDIL